MVYLECVTGYIPTHHGIPRVCNRKDTYLPGGVPRVCNSVYMPPYRQGVTGCICLPANLRKERDNEARSTYQPQGEERDNEARSILIPQGEEKGNEARLISFLLG